MQRERVLELLDPRRDVERDVDERVETPALGAAAAADRGLARVAAEHVVRERRLAAARVVRVAPARLEQLDRFSGAEQREEELVRVLLAAGRHALGDEAHVAQQRARAERLAGRRAPGARREVLQLAERAERARRAPAARRVHARVEERAQRARREQALQHRVRVAAVADVEQAARRRRAARRRGGAGARRGGREAQERVVGEDDLARHGRVLVLLLLLLGLLPGRRCCRPILLPLLLLGARLALMLPPLPQLQARRQLPGRRCRHRRRRRRARVLLLPLLLQPRALVLVAAAPVLALAARGAVYVCGFGCGEERGAPA